MAAKKKAVEPEVIDVEEAELVSEEAVNASEEQPLNAVIVVKVEDEDGNIGTNVIPNGDVRPTEIQTLLELAINSWREQIGVGQSKR